ncbi:MAG: DUF2160 domain-containing protein [Gammaproteobacteria bacterium]|nr:DUF2160 domain-containing protein [Gammaproteobacteria bacterium]
MSWMAWTGPTALFFASIGLGLLAMTLWQLLSPSIERASVFGIRTTRGDRFFVSLLGSAFIELGWIGLLGDYYIVSASVCLLYTWVVFRWF